MNISPSIINTLKLSPIDEKQEEKNFKDLKFIFLLTEIAKSENMRVVIHGGYAVDGFFGKLTRPHNDIDIVLYGISSNGSNVIHEFLGKIAQKDSSFLTTKITDKGRNEWTHEFSLKDHSFLAEIYYVQVKENPFDSIKIVVSRNGLFAEPENYEVYQNVLKRVSFESCTPIQAIVDRLYKQRRGDGIKAHHMQDIENLRLITDEEEVNNKLQTYRGY